MLRASISELFATDGSFNDSVAHQLLLRLSFFLLLAPLASSDREFQAAIAAQHQVVQVAPGVLQTISMMDFPGASPVEENDDLVCFGAQITRKKKFKQQRRAPAKSRALDPKPFQTLGHSIPGSRSEVESLTGRLSEQLKGILNVG